MEVRHDMILFFGGILKKSLASVLACPFQNSKKLIFKSLINTFIDPNSLRKTTTFPEKTAHFPHNFPVFQPFAPSFPPSLRQVGLVNGNLPVEAPRARERRVQDVDSVGPSQDHYTGAGGKTILRSRKKLKRMLFKGFLFAFGCWGNWRGWMEWTCEFRQLLGKMSWMFLVVREIP